MKGNTMKWVVGVLALIVAALVLGYVLAPKHLAETGRVLDRHFNEDGLVDGLVLQLSDGRDIEVYIQDRAEEIPADPEMDFDRWITEECHVFCSGIPGKSELDWDLEGGIRTYIPDFLTIDSVWDGTEQKLMDGTPYQMWKKPGEEMTQYRLSDGTLFFTDDRHSSLPESFMAQHDYGFSELDPDVRQKIISYYNESEELCDIEKEVEKAYRGYLKYGGQKDYQSYFVEQFSYPCGTSEKVLYILTEADLPVDGLIYENRRFTWAFDKSSGDRIPAEELFVCTPAELAETLAQRNGGVEDEAFLSELKQKADLDYLVVTEEETSLTYPLGTLSDYPDGNYVIYGDNRKDILSLYQPWARPKE